MDNESLIDDKFFAQGHSCLDDPLSNIDIEDLVESEPQRIRRPNSVIQKSRVKHNPKSNFVNSITLSKPESSTNSLHLQHNLESNFAPAPPLSGFLFDSEVECSSSPNLPSDTQSFVPGAYSIYAKTWGCTHNTSDTEYMLGLLAQHGYRITENKHEADVWLLNSCTVKTPAEHLFRNALSEARRLRKRVVLAGCVPESSAGALSGLLRSTSTSNDNSHSGDASDECTVSALGVQQIDRVLEVLEETLKGHSVRLFGARRALDPSSGRRRKTGGAPLAMPKIRKNPLIEIVPISTGSSFITVARRCLNQCTYCKTRHARGELGSYSPAEIVERVKQAFTEGVVEVWLTSEDTGAYGHDIGSNLPELLRLVIAALPPYAMLRVGMTNPKYLLPHLEEMMQILRHPQVYSFLHIPVQSGSDAVLLDMKRECAEYTVEEFELIVNTLLTAFPASFSASSEPSSLTCVPGGGEGVSVDCGEEVDADAARRLTLATDLIAAFPSESESDFEATVALVRRYRFPVLFINQFYARPGTPAARMPRLASPAEIGKVYKALVTEESFDKAHLVAHNKSYEQILISKSAIQASESLGRWLEVRVTATDKFAMIGTVLRVCHEWDALLPSLPRAVRDRRRSSTSDCSDTGCADCSDAGCAAGDHCAPVSSSSSHPDACRNSRFSFSSALSLGEKYVQFVRQSSALLLQPLARRNHMSALKFLWFGVLFGFLSYRLVRISKLYSR